MDRLREEGDGAYVHECGIDVVAALSIDGNEEGKAAVRGQVGHEAVLLVVPGKEGDAAVLRLGLRGHRVQRLTHTHTQ